MSRHYQTPDDPSRLQDPAERFGYLLWQTAHVVERRLAGCLEPFGLTPAQFGLLVHTGREPGVSAAELARRLNLTPQAVQTALRPLLENGSVERRSHPVNRKVLTCFLSAEGLALTRRASEAVTRTDDELLASLTDAQAQQLRGHLRQALQSLNGLSGGPGPGAPAQS